MSIWNVGRRRPQHRPLAHRRGLPAEPDKFRVATICDLDEARLNAVGDEFGIERPHDVLRRPARRSRRSTSSTSARRRCLHRPQVEAALAAGKHVVCEKPLTGSLADVDAIIAAEKGAKGVLMPIFQYRYGDGIEKAKRIIDAGIAGKPYVGTVETFWRRTPEYYAVPWRGKWATELGGVLVTHALHLHDMLLLARWARSARVFGRVATRVNDIEVEDCASASLLMAERRARLADLHARLGRTRSAGCGCTSRTSPSRASTPPIRRATTPGRSSRRTTRCSGGSTR